MPNDKKLVVKINCQTQNKGVTEKAVSPPQMISEWNTKRIALAGLILFTIMSIVIYQLLMSDDSVEENLNQRAEYDRVISGDMKNKPLIKDNIKSEVSQPELKGIPFEQSEEQQTETHGKENKQSVKANTHDNEITEKVAPVAPSLVDNNKKGVEKPGQMPLPDGLVRAQLAKNINNKEPVGTLTTPVVVDKKQAKGVFYFTELKSMKGKTVYHEWVYEGKTIYKRKVNILGNRWRASTRKMINYKLLGSWAVMLVDANGKVMHRITFDVDAKKN